MMSVKGRISLVLALLYLLSGFSSAYENSSTNDNYRELLDGQPISAVLHTYTKAFGGGTQGQIAYAIMIMMFYSMVFMSLRDINVANFLLSYALYIYFVYVPAISWPVFVFLIIFGVVATIWRGYSSYNSGG